MMYEIVFEPLRGPRVKQRLLTDKYRVAAEFLRICEEADVPCEIVDTLDDEVIAATWHTNPNK